MIRLGEVHGIRRKAYEGPICELPDHDWDRLEDDGFVLLVLCRNCGRTPLEMLDELKIEGVR